MGLRTQTAALSSLDLPRMPKQTRLINGRKPTPVPQKFREPPTTTRQLTMLEDAMSEEQTRSFLARAASASLDEWARLLRFVLNDSRLPAPEFDPLRFVTCLKWLDGALVARLGPDGDLFVQTPEVFGAQPMKDARQAFTVITETLQKKPE